MHTTSYSKNVYDENDKNNKDNKLNENNKLCMIWLQLFAHIITLTVGKWANM